MYKQRKVKMQFYQGRYGQFISALLFALYMQGTIAANAPVVNDSFPKWTGFFGGVDLGYTTSNNRGIDVNAYTIQAFPSSGGPQSAAASVSSGTGLFNLNNDGFIGGGHIGALWASHNNYVAGFEVDIQGIANGTHELSTSKNATILGFAPDMISSNLSVSRDINYLGSVRGRFGYLLTPTILFSGTGGIAYGGVSSSTTINQSNNPAVPTLTTNWASTGNYSNTLIGWTVGGNFEWMLRANWSASLQYLYYDLGRVTYSNGKLTNIALAGGPTPAGDAYYTNAVDTSTRFDGHIVRMALSYHFN